MRIHPASLIVLFVLNARPAAAQEVHAGLGYAHIFRAGGFSFGAGYLHSLSAPAAPIQQSLGGTFWYANTEIASLGPGAAARELMGLGARYELELTRCCGRVHPLLAVPLEVLHSSVPGQVIPAAAVAALQGIPRPGPAIPPEDQGGGAWGWGAGVELGMRLPVGEQWDLQTSGTMMYHDIYAQSTTHDAWIWHLGLSYRFGGVGAQSLTATAARRWR
jgi:hypothetical protein